jgi:hypothetical protein
MKTRRFGRFSIGTQNGFEPRGKGWFSYTRLSFREFEMISGKRILLSLL